MELLQTSEVQECADPGALPADVFTRALVVLFGAGVSMAAGRKWETGARQRAELSVTLITLNR